MVVYQTSKSFILIVMNDGVIYYRAQSSLNQALLDRDGDANEKNGWDTYHF